MSTPFTFFDPHWIASILQELREVVESASPPQEPEFDFRQLLSQSTGSQPSDQERPDGEAKSHGGS